MQPLASFPAPAADEEQAVLALTLALSALSLPAVAPEAEARGRRVVRGLRDGAGTTACWHRSAPFCRCHQEDGGGTTVEDAWLERGVRTAPDPELPPVALLAPPAGAVEPATLAPVPVLSVPPVLAVAPAAAARDRRPVRGLLDGAGAPTFGVACTAWRMVLERFPSALPTLDSSKPRWWPSPAGAVAAPSSRRRSGSPRRVRIFSWSTAEAEASPCKCPPLLQDLRCAPFTLLVLLLRPWLPPRALLALPPPPPAT